MAKKDDYIILILHKKPTNPLFMRIYDLVLIVFNLTRRSANAKSTLH